MGDRAHAGDGLGVRRVVDLPVGVEQVWEALTEPERVADWFGARVTWQLRPGGPARFDGDDGSVRAGEVDEVEPGRRLRYRWWPLGDGGDGRGPGTSAVRYELEPTPEGTRLVITETPLDRPGGAPIPVASAAAPAPVAPVVWDLRLLWLCVACAAPLLVRA